MTIPVRVLTGFLGAGKSTLLNRLLKAPDFAATAVLVNEFGEVGVNHLLNITGEPCPVIVHGVQHVFHPPVMLAD